MSKLLTASLLALLATSISLPLTSAAYARCTTDHVCTPDEPDPGKPGDPPPPDDHKDPGSPGDPYVPPDFFVADVIKNMLISCRISGTPEAQPDDLKFRNIGDLVIPAGTRVYWMVKESGDHGYFVLPADLQVGESVKDEGVLAIGLPTTDHCYSKIV